ncbi:hypothetical protein [Microbulbifer sp. SA54]|uniref:hypothetical protein n=1 Tax=Microbulbifer sp. SA54 TaxID=3401577 RepID=UPI003AADF11D
MDIFGSHSVDRFDDLAGLEETSVLWRLVVVLQVSVIFMFYDRHIFYGKARHSEERKIIKY